MIGGLLNVTFGNAPELIIALFALEPGLHEVVKASLIGSILGNVAARDGRGDAGRRAQRGPLRRVQKFGRTAANVQSTMLLLAIAALIMPAVFALVEGEACPGRGPSGSPTAATWSTSRSPSPASSSSPTSPGLVFTLKTHVALFNPHEEESSTEGRGDWTVRRSVTALAIAGCWSG